MSVDVRETYLESEVLQADGCRLVGLLYGKALESLAEFSATELLALRSLHHRLGAGAWVHPACIRRDLDALLHERRKQALHQGHEVLGVSNRGVTGALLLHDGHRHLCEVVHHEVVEGPPFHLAPWGLEPVSPEPLSGAGR